MTRLTITGAIDRCEETPTASPVRILWIGNFQVTWSIDGEPRCYAAAILRVETGGAGDVLALRWIGDPPEPDIARSVYDWVRDRGWSRGVLEVEIDSLPHTLDAASYQAVRRPVLVVQR